MSTQRVQISRLSPSSPLGFVIRGGAEYGLGHVVCDVNPASPAALANLQIGDEILRIDGFPLGAATHDEVVALLNSRENPNLLVKKAKPPYWVPIKIVDNEQKQPLALWKPYGNPNLAENRGKSDLNENFNYSNFQRLTTNKYLRRACVLGCSLIEDRDGVIVVDRVQKQSLAEKAGLDEGDVLVAVNGRDLQTNPLQLEQIVELLANSDCLDLAVRKNNDLMFDKTSNKLRSKAISRSANNLAKESGRFESSSARFESNSSGYSSSETNNTLARLELKDVSEERLRLEERMLQEERSKLQEEQERLRREAHRLQAERRRLEEKMNNNINRDKNDNFDKNKREEDNQSIEAKKDKEEMRGTGGLALQLKNELEKRAAQRANSNGGSEQSLQRLEVKKMRGLVKNDNYEALMMEFRQMHCKILNKKGQNEDEIDASSSTEGMEKQEEVVQVPIQLSDNCHQQNVTTQYGIELKKEPKIDYNNKKESNAEINNNNEEEEALAMQQTTFRAIAKHKAGSTFTEKSQIASSTTTKITNATCEGGGLEKSQIGENNRNPDTLVSKNNDGLVKIAKNGNIRDGSSDGLCRFHEKQHQQEQELLLNQQSRRLRRKPKQAPPPPPLRSSSMQNALLSSSSFSDQDISIPVPDYNKEVNNKRKKRQTMSKRYSRSMNALNSLGKDDKDDDLMEFGHVGNGHSVSVSNLYEHMAKSETRGATKGHNNRSTTLKSGRLAQREVNLMSDLTSDQDSFVFNPNRSQFSTQNRNATQLALRDYRALNALGQDNNARRRKDKYGNEDYNDELKIELNSNFTLKARKLSSSVSSSSTLSSGSGQFAKKAVPVVMTHGRSASSTFSRLMASKGLYATS